VNCEYQISKLANQQIDTEIMKKTSLLFLSLILCTLFSFTIAQTYTTGFDNPGEQAGWTEYRLGVDDPFYEWEYSAFSAYSEPNCLSHNYPVGGTEVSDDWFVSPAFDFSEGGTIDTIWRSFSGFGFPEAGDTVAIYVLNGDADPELATSKTLLIQYEGDNYMNDNIWRSDADIAVPNLPGQSYIAFRYKTIVNWLDVKFDDLSITEHATSGNQSPLLNADVRIFPNPTSDVLRITGSETLSIKSISIFDTNGSEVREFNGNATLLDLNGLPEGVYFLRFNTENGVILRQFVKI
jgi:hypothetical protein